MLAVVIIAAIVAVVVTIHCCCYRDSIRFNIAGYTYCSTLENFDDADFCGLTDELV